MKDIVLKGLAVIGVLSIMVLGLRLAIPSESHEEMARRTFGTPEAVAALRSLYERVEREAPALTPAGAKVRDIPQSWMPEPFARRWSAFFFPDTSAVFARFDDRGSLLDLEFMGSRFGAFLSRDPARCSREFTTLHRYATSPIYVAGVLTDEE
jgi:hypothetical protein